jgi:ABC-2 type transport system ATP-binding protein
MALSGEIYSENSSSPLPGIAVELSGLTKRYGAITAVNNLNLEIQKGTIFGFLGPNGAGKTTTIRMLLGLIKPTTGRASILGFDIEKQRANLLPLISAVVENPTFYPNLSGRDNLKLIATARGNIKAARIEEVLELVELTDRAKDKVKSYSLGMKQRLGIAGTLLNQPQVIFLDEPTNGLDPQGTVDMRNLILRLRQSGRTVFLSSHLLYEIEQVCSHVAIINKGTTLIQGEVKQLLKGKDGFTLEVDPLPMARQVLAAYLPDESQVKVIEPHQIQVHLQREQIPALVESLVRAGVRIYAVAPFKASLEDYFLSVTQPELATAGKPA